MVFCYYEGCDITVDLSKQDMDEISCMEIKRKLNEEYISLSNIVVKDVFGLEIYFLIRPITSICNIASALDIPSDWVKWYDSNNIIIDKRKLDDKYCNNRGIIDFPDDWSMLGKDSEDVKIRLEEKGIGCITDYQYCGDFEFIVIEVANGYRGVIDDIIEALKIEWRDIGIIKEEKCYIVPKIRK